jgi:hypothetical protein
MSKAVVFNTLSYIRGRVVFGYSYRNPGYIKLISDNFINLFFYRERDVNRAG